MGSAVVGITAYAERARWDIWDTPATLTPCAYVNAIARAGGTPVVLPPSPGIAEALVDRLDALVLAAGADVDPARYGEAMRPETACHRVREAAEWPLLEAALAQNLPVFGVCRGMQMLAVAYGGALHQHLPDALGHEAHCPRVGTISRHPVTATGAGVVGSAIGRRAHVSSHHHQGVRDPGSLVITAWSEDGLPEAIEDPARRFVLGVQWHAELDSPELFAALVAAAGVDLDRRMKCVGKVSYAPDRRTERGDSGAC